MSANYKQEIWVYNYENKNFLRQFLSTDCQVIGKKVVPRLNSIRPFMTGGFLFFRRILFRFAESAVHGNSGTFSCRLHKQLKYSNKRLHGIQK